MSIFVNVLADVVHFANIIIICEMFFSLQKRVSKKFHLLLVLAGFIMGAVSLSIYILENHYFETITYIFVVIMLLYALYREKFKTVFSVAIWIIFALSMIYVMASVLFDMIVGIVGNDLEVMRKLFASIVSTILVYFIGKKYQKDSTEGMTSIGLSNLFWFTLLMIIDTVVVSVIGFLNVSIRLEKFKIVFQVAVIFVIIGIFIQLAAVISLFMQRNVYKEKKKLTEKYLNEQRNYYEYLEEREKETKKFRHDLRSHMELISNLAKNREYEEIDKYLKKMHIKIDSFGNLITVQNGIVDAIINQYYAKAQQSGITMEVKGRFPEECAIDAYDLCTIFSNVLSNALEAAVETEEKTILLECRYNDKNIIIVVKNSYNSEHLSRATQWKTRKENTDYHGYGLENMRECVERYNGVFDIEADDHIFTLTILFNNIGKQEYENCNC